MAAHRRSGRFVGLAAISGPLVVAAIVGAGPARADAASYLNDMHKAGIQEVGGDPALLDTGRKLCVQIGYGVTSDQLTALAVQHSDAAQGARGLTPVQASELVNYAIADLCPNY
jgi:Protein of unknown function (DUF732)